jgi:hypothetical protein
LEARWSHGAAIGKCSRVVRFGQIQTSIVQAFALRQVMVILIRQEAAAHTTHQGFREAMVDVERGDWERKQQQQQQRPTNKNTLAITEMLLSNSSATSSDL